MTPARLGEIAVWDRRYFGQDRYGLFAIAIDNPTFRGYVCRSASGISGYMFLTENTKFQVVGPLVVDPSVGADVVSLLLNAASEKSDKPFYLSMGFGRLFTQNCWLKQFDDGG